MAGSPWDGSIGSAAGYGYGVEALACTEGHGIKEFRFYFKHIGKLLKRFRQ